MIEAQQSLIASIVLDQDALVEVIDNLNVNDFTTDRHRRIISAAFDLTNENKEIDVVSLGERSDSLDYLIESTTESHRMSLPVAIGMVKNESVRRLSLSNLDFAIQKVLKCKTPDEQVLALEAVTNGIDVGRDDFRVLQEVMRDATKRISDKLDGKFVEGFKTGFNTIDERLGGFVEGNMVVVGARPSMGKTTYALNVCENVAKAGGNTIFFSLEMSADELADKMISSSSGLSTDVIRKPRFGPGSLDEDGQSKLMAGMTMINGFANNFTVIDKAALHINHLRNIARKFDRVKHLDLIVIDYLQLLRADSQNRFDEISEISRSIKALAKELNTTVLVLSQLSREVDKLSLIHISEPTRPY